MVRPKDPVELGLLDALNEELVHLYLLLLDMEDD